MVRVCCVTGCKNIWNPTCDISYFAFPLKNENLLEKWKQVIPTTYEITKYTTICSDHFSNASYTYKSGKRFLNKNAVPTIFHITSVAEENFDCSFTEQERKSSIEPVTRTCRETFCVDRETQTSLLPVEVPKHVGTQISPRRLPPSETEEQLRKKIKLLTSRLHRRESKISTMTELLSDFRKNERIDSQRTDVAGKRENDNTREGRMLRRQQQIDVLETSTLTETNSILWARNG